MKKSILTFLSLGLLWGFQAQAQCDGGSVTSQYGNEVTIIKDGVPDPVVMSNESLTQAASYQYVVTNDTGLVLAYPPNNIIDLDGVSVGTCLVFGVSYTGTLEETTMISIDEVSSDACVSVSEDYVAISRKYVDGGYLDIPEGLEQLIIVDGEPDPIALGHETLTPDVPYEYVITDDEGTILAMPGSVEEVDLDGAGTGVCRVYGVASLSGLPMAGGMMIYSLITDTTDISKNYLEVTRKAVDGGKVNPDGMTEFKIAVDGTPDPVALSHETATPEAMYEYVITDDEGTILAMPGMISEVDLDGAGVGVCRVYGVASVDGVPPSMGLNVMMLNTDTTDVSYNYVQIDRKDLDGGEVFSDMGEEVLIIVDGMEDPVGLSHETVTPSANYEYIITDDEGNILAYPGAIMEVDLDGAGVGVCRVYGAAFSETLPSMMGLLVYDLNSDTINISENYIEITRKAVDGGMVDSEFGLNVEIIVDGVEDPIMISHETETPTADYAYVITDYKGTILAYPGSVTEVDLDGAGVGTCRVYGVAYSNGLPMPMGEFVGSLNSDTVDVSSNWIEISRVALDGGTVFSDLGIGFEICVDDEEDPFEVGHISESESASYGYAITNASDTVLVFPGMSTLDLNGAGPGLCKVYGFAYTGVLDDMTGVHIDDLMSSGSISVSDNYVEVSRIEVIGGMVDSDMGTEVTIEVDGTPDPVTVSHDSPTAEFQYVITDDVGTVLVFPGSNVIDLDGAGEGVCRVYGVAFSDELIMETGIPVWELEAEGCIEISENYIEITRTVISGINDAEIVSGLVFPNPLETKLMVLHPEAVGVELISAFGEVKVLDFQGSAGAVLPELEAGIYFAAIQLADGSTLMQRVVKN